jgi:TolA-binding protein
MMRTRSLRWLLPVAALLAAGLAAVPARAQIESREGIALRDQIDELRHEVQILQDRVSNGRGGSLLGSAAQVPPPPSMAGGNDVTARLLVRVDQLDEQVRQLRGRIDELQNQLQQQTADLGKRIDDLTFLVENPKAAAAAAASARQSAAAGTTSAPPSPTGPMTPPPPTGVLGTIPAGPPGGAPPYAGPPGTTRPPPRTPELAMQDGTAALARRDYATAEADAREILNNNRTSPRAYDAMFLLAQAQSGQHQYSQAALSYDDVYNRSRKGPHAPDALLGLANALVGLNDKPSACQALTKLHAEFPTLRSDLHDQVAFTYGRAGCR